MQKKLQQPILNIDTLQKRLCRLTGPPHCLVLFLVPFQFFCPIHTQYSLVFRPEDAPATACVYGPPLAATPLPGEAVH